MPHVIKKLLKYSMKDIWNADEFGLCYKFSPNSTVVPGRIPVQKKKKERLTYLSCANADGSEKFPILKLDILRSLNVFKT